MRYLAYYFWRGADFFDGITGFDGINGIAKWERLGSAILRTNEERKPNSLCSGDPKSKINRNDLTFVFDEVVGTRIANPNRHWPGFIVDFPQPILFPYGN